MIGPPGEAGPAPSFSPQAMMSMFRQPSSTKGYQADDAKAYSNDDLTDITKIVDSMYYTVP